MQRLLQVITIEWEIKIGQKTISSPVLRSFEKCKEIYPSPSFKHYRSYLVHFTPQVICFHSPLNEVVDPNVTLLWATYLNRQGSINKAPIS